MRIKLEASARLRASEDTDWFESLTKEQQEDYLEDHPNSKHAKDAKARSDKEESDDKAGRIAYLRKQIPVWENDIQEIQSDGEDASREIEQLNDMREELKSLS